MFLDWYYYDFWRSCDTEDWSNDAENTDINYSLTEINFGKSEYNMYIVFTQYFLYLYNK